MKKIVVLAAIVILISSSAMATDRYAASKTDPAAVIADLVVVRPFSLAATAVGCVVFVAALPFTVWSKDRIAAVGKGLVVNPGSYTFVRPLGEGW